MSAVIKHGKPRAFYDTFERKGPGEKITHYCPGCGHGTVHKLIAAAIDDLGIQDRTIFCSPVGCAVFGYYYFDTGNIQCPHGRAPAVATGIRRVLPESIVICYQGDGDLAAIGTAEIIHAANRGENLTVFFVNNATYGMTGGQMAPTTLLGQKTATTPEGRSESHDGAPIGAAELLNALKTPVFIERVSLATPGQILKARAVFKRALLNQVQKKGFSFVEILSPCPINWRMTPAQAREWIKTDMEPVFPPGNCRNRTTEPAVPPAPPPVADSGDKMLQGLLQKEKPEMHLARQHSCAEQYVKIAGFGGQGVMSAGILLANCAMVEGLNTTWLPSYGPEMRGGTANASVIISESSIGSPVVDAPNALLAMNLPSLDMFEESLTPGGLIIVNSSIVDRTIRRRDARACYVPASQLASEAGLLAAGNVIMLTVYALLSKAIAIETLKAVIPLSIKNKKFLELNLKMVERAAEFYAQLQ